MPTVLADDDNPLDGAKPLCGAEGRYGEVILAQGHGARPLRWGADDVVSVAGITPPAAGPDCIPLLPVRYYVARCDVMKPGACYNKPPAVTFSTPASPPAGFVAAKAKAYLDQASVSEVVVESGGRNYPDPPTVALSATHGTGGAISVTMDTTLPSPTSITQVDIVDGPPFAGDTEINLEQKTQWVSPGPIDVTVSNAGGTIAQNWWIYSEECDGPGGSLYEGWAYVGGSITYTVSGGPTGSGLKVRIGFYGHGFRTVRTDPCHIFWWGSWGVDQITVLDAGAGYAAGSAFTITIPSNSSAERKLVLEARTPGNSRNTATPRAAIKSLAVSSAGSGYIVAPELKVISDSGFGAAAYCTVNAAGQIATVVLESGGGGFKTVPTIEVVSGGAEAFAVARPHVRGKYQCYYRYIDSTPEANGGPIPSSLSPVTVVDAGEGAGSIRWTVNKPATEGERATKAELWRTTGDQETTLYRVATIASFTPEPSPPGTSFTATYTDDLTDEELRDPDRAGYAAMPIVLPNGELVANRFSSPPADKSAVVRFQDRFWYGVDTSGTQPNTVYFSEVDEPESVPDINEFVLQQNTTDSDVLTAMAPFGSVLLLMQRRHAYSLSYSQKPLTDASVSLVAYRGCVNQRCWAIHAGLCYVMDQRGIYSISQGGELSDLSRPINDIFRGAVDYTASDAFFLSVDPSSEILRAFVALKDDESVQPAARVTRALCYHIESKSWWVEKYPQQIYSATSLLTDDGDYRSVFATDSGLALLDEGSYDIARGSASIVTLLNPGSGYTRPPVVKPPAGGVGAEFAASIDAEGKLTGIAVLSPGYGYEDGALDISPPDDPSGTQATGYCEFSAVDEDEVRLVTYRAKTGAAALPNDSQDPAAGSSASRDISLSYRPQLAECEVALRLYYNNSSHPRRNVAARNRGVGFRHSTVDSSARLDMGALTAATGADSGIAKSLFAGRTIDDIRSSDRHVAVEMSGAAQAGAPVTFYALEVYGTSGEA